MSKVYRFDFKKLDSYQAALLHFGWCLRIAGRIPWDRKVVTNQMLRASLSVVLNLGEAGGRKEEGESAQFLRYARGSLFESAAMLDALSLMEVISDDEYNTQEELLARVGAMLTAMIRRKTGSRGSANAPGRSRSRSRSRP
jgi:four helix bundle protein